MIASRAEHPALPAYSVRVSKRARHVRLTVTPKDGLVVVVPTRFRGDVAAIVADKRAWAEAALARVADQHAIHAAGPDAMLPDRVELAAISATWPVSYRMTAAGTGRVQARLSAVELVVAGDVADAAACLAALDRWLDRTARDILLPMLEQVASQAGIAYAGGRVRRQRTRWGSCSARRTISLNRNLVFVPEHLVRALMLHELAHIAHLDHSARFWAHLATLDPEYAEHRAQLREAGRRVPVWADA